MQAVNSTDPTTVITQMRKSPVKDAFTSEGSLREDGRMVHDVFLVQIKKPADSTSEWDLQKVVATLPGKDAFRPIVGADLSLRRNDAQQEIGYDTGHGNVLSALRECASFLLPCKAGAPDRRGLPAPRAG